MQPVRSVPSNVSSQSSRRKAPPRPWPAVGCSWGSGVVVASAQTSDEFGFLKQVGAGTRFVIPAQPPSDSCTCGEEHGPHSAPHRARSGRQTASAENLSYADRPFRESLDVTFPNRPTALDQSETLPLPRIHG